jgi:hypothetical protein
MNKAEFIESIKKKVDLNKESAVHIFICWVAVIDKYTENKDAILKFFHEDFFPIRPQTSDYPYFMNFFSVMAALEKRVYFNEIVFKSTSTPSSINNEDIENALWRFLNIYLFVSTEDKILHLNDVFFKLIIPIFSGVWDSRLKIVIDMDEPNKQYLNNLVSIAFSHLFSTKRWSLSMQSLHERSFIRTRDYFKLISLGIPIDSNKLMTKILEGSFFLHEDSVWMKNINHFYYNKKLSPYMRRIFKTDQERKYLNEHLESLTSNTALMVLLFLNK